MLKYNKNEILIQIYKYRTSNVNKRQMLQSQIFDTYSHAYEHAIKLSRCAHISCGLLINGKLVRVDCNTIQSHAEMACLKWLLDKGDPFEGK